MIVFTIRRSPQDLFKLPNNIRRIKRVINHSLNSSNLNPSFKVFFVFFESEFLKPIQTVPDKHAASRNLKMYLPIDRSNPKKNPSTNTQFVRIQIPNHFTDCQAVLDSHNS